MRKFWVVLLSVLFFIIGVGGGFVWLGAASSLRGLSIACAVLDEAGKQGFVKKEDRDKLIDGLVHRSQAKDKSSSGWDALARELKAGCPQFRSGT